MYLCVMAVFDCTVAEGEEEGGWKCDEWVRTMIKVGDDDDDEGVW